MKIVEFKKEYTQRWQDYVDEKENSCLYHSIIWQEVMKYFNFKPKFLFAQENNRIKGILPLYETKGFFEKRLVATPLRDRGGILTDNQKAFNLLYDYSKELCIKDEYSYVEIKLEDRKFINEESVVKQDNVTNQLLLPDSYESYFKSLTSNNRRKIRKAEKENVIIDIMNTAEGLEIFYHLFLITRKRLGVPPNPFGFFKNMFNILIPKNFINIFIAKINNKPAAGIILLCFKDTATYAYGGSDYRFFKKYPNNLIFAKAINFSIQNKYKIFEFGPSWKNQTDLIKFKESWNSKTKPLYSLYYTKRGNIPNNNLTSPKYHFARVILRHSPAFALKILGKLLYNKYS